MRLEFFRSVLALALAAAWHGVAVNGEAYVARCIDQPTQFMFTGSESANLYCGEAQTANYTGDSTNDGVEVSIKDSIATITVREGTNSPNLYVMIC